MYNKVNAWNHTIKYDTILGRYKFGSLPGVNTVTGSS